MGESCFVLLMNPKEYDFKISHYTLLRACTKQVWM